MASSTQQKQDLTNLADAIYTNACRVDVIPSDELIEAIYGKIDDLDGIRAMLEGVNDSGWQALYHPEMNSYLPSDPPLEEDKAFEVWPPFSNDAHVPLGISIANCIVQLKGSRTC